MQYLGLLKAQHLSMCGRLTLIKFILCSFPIYSLSVKLLPTRIRNTLQSVMRRFLSGGSEDKKKMELVNRDTVTTAYEKRQLGIPNLGDLNVALLVKWISCYKNEIDSLWKRVVCAKSGADPNSLTLSFSTRSKKSSLINLIRSLLDRNNVVASAVSSRFRHLVRNGVHSDF